MRVESTIATPCNDPSIGDSAEAILLTLHEIHRAIDGTCDIMTGSWGLATPPPEAKGLVMKLQVAAQEAQSVLSRMLALRDLLGKADAKHPMAQNIGKEA